MKLTLEQILEELKGYNFVCITNPDYFIPFKTVELCFPLNKPILDENKEDWIYERGTKYFQIPEFLLDYSGDWRNSLRSRGDIKPSIVYVTEKDYLVGRNLECGYDSYECPNCECDELKKPHSEYDGFGTKFCPDCGIKLNWVD